MISPLTALLLLTLVVAFSQFRTPSDAVDALALAVLAFFGLMVGLVVVVSVVGVMIFATICFAFMQAARLVASAARALKTAALKNRSLDR